MPRLAALALMLFAFSPLAGDDPATKLPASAKAAIDKQEAALAEARKAFEAASDKANKALADELTQLQADATKAGKLEDAVALRDAVRAARLGDPQPSRTLVFEKNKDKGTTLTIVPGRGFRWSDWKPGDWAQMRSTPLGTACYHLGNSNKVWAYLVVTFDRSEACWWTPGEAPVFLRPKK